MMKTMEYTGTLIVMTCHCGLKHAVPQLLYDRWRNRQVDHLHCPVGHEYIPGGENVAEKLRAQVTSLCDTLDACRDSRDSAWRSQSATKGHITRLKKRIAAGVCPCCNKTFQNLAKHMKSQHSKYINGR